MAGIEPEFEQPFTAWKQNANPQTAGAMLKAVDPVINTAMRSFGGNNSPTLRIKAKQIVIDDALPSYSPDRGSLRSHLMSRLQRLQRLSGREQSAISLPERVALDQMHMERSRKELEDSLSRPPSDQELADHAGLSLRRIGHIRRGVRSMAESTITQQNASGAGGYDPSARGLNEDDPWLEFVYMELGPTDQTILERSLGLHGHTPIHPIELARTLKVSPAAISKRMTKIQGLLDRRDELEAF